MGLYKVKVLFALKLPDECGLLFAHSYAPSVYIISIHCRCLRAFETFVTLRVLAVTECFGHINKNHCRKHVVQRMNDSVWNIKSENLC